MDLHLAGRGYLVTGASSGVGLATARALLAEGASVAACARDPERLRERLADAAPEERMFLASADVRDAEQMRAFTDGAARAFGRLDGVVANAGRSLMAALDETGDDQLREEFDLKLFGVLNTVRPALEWLELSTGASIVVVNAILARQPESRLAATSAARAALLNLTRTMATDYGPRGVRVNSVALGLVDTGQWRRRYEDSGTELSYEDWCADLAADRGIPLGRLGTAEEVAHPVVSLLSPRASYVTGATVDVGGGIARYV
ncbi:SDR family oxidoreductase [Nocardiopsis sp. HNM0947]|uniref:SDR family oxidoreductase n=1 Tax=Nocardiopsis coralli TaxID=2772213 RepID=A0ABR9P253_9ACTN|nr:SDR family oxidoreductase [Nocardiopsis coralli]MBE2997925.1 SDR family oxidoreductase [Nocardiopsis coralli]